MLRPYENGLVLFFGCWEPVSRIRDPFAKGFLLGCAFKKAQSASFEMTSLVEGFELIAQKSL
jgi:hypothetical protein